MKELRKRTTKEDLNLLVFNKIKSGKRPSEIVKELNIKPSSLQYYLDYLKNNNYIVKKGYGVWEILKNYETFSLGTTKPLTNLHALHIKFPILTGKIDDSDWQIKEKLNNWIPKYTPLKALGGLTVKNNNNKSISVYVKSRNITSLSEIDNLSYQVRDYIYMYFKSKYNVELDKYNVEVKNLDIATEDKHAEGMRKKGEKFVLTFDKQASKIFPKDNLQSKALIDGSPFNFSAETNDKDWKKEYLQMPFKTAETLQLLHYVAQNYASHVGVVDKLNKLLDIPKVKEHIKNSVKNKNQSKLGDFL
jgi:hypothetical protein